MPILATAADGTEHEFPDGTSEAVVDRAMLAYARETARPKAQPRPKTQPTSPSARPPSVADLRQKYGETDKYSGPIDVAKVKALAQRPAAPTALQMREFATGKPESTTAVGTFGKHAARGAFPTLAAAVGGARTGATAGRWLGPIGAAGGALAGSVGAGIGAMLAQEKLLEAVPTDVKEKVGQADWQLEASAREHPYAAFAGGVAPGVLMGNVPTRIPSALMGAGLGGALEGAREFFTEGKLDPGKLAIASGAGIAGMRTNKYSQKLYGKPDTQLQAAIRERPPAAEPALETARLLREAGVEPRPIEVIGDADAVPVARRVAAESPRAAELLRKYSEETRGELPARAAPVVDSAIPDAPGRTPAQIKADLEARYGEADLLAASEIAKAKRRGDTKVTTIGKRTEQEIAATGDDLKAEYDIPVQKDTAGESIQHAAAKWSEDMRAKGGQLIEAAEAATAGIPLPPSNTLKFIDDELRLAERNPHANRTLIQMLSGWKSDLSSGQTTDLATLRDLRRSIYRTSAPEGLKAGDVDRLRGTFWNTLKTDIENGLNDASADNPKAAEGLDLFRQGNAVWSDRQSALDTSLGAVLGKSVKEDLSDPENIVYVAQQAPEAATAAVRKFASGDSRALETLINSVDEPTKETIRDLAVTSMGRGAKGEIDAAKFIAEAKALPRRTREVLFGDQPIEAVAERVVAKRAALEKSGAERQRLAELGSESRQEQATRAAEVLKAREAPVEAGVETGGKFATMAPVDFADTLAVTRGDPRAMEAMKVSARQWLKDELKTPDSARRLLETMVGENGYAQTNLAALLGAKEAATFVRKAQTLAKRARTAAAVEPGVLPGAPAEHGTAGTEGAAIQSGFIATGHGLLAYPARKFWTFLRGRGMSEAQAEELTRDVLDPTKTEDTLRFIEKMYGQSAFQAAAGRVKAAGAKYANIIQNMTTKVTAQGAGWDSKAGRREPESKGLDPVEAEPEAQEDGETPVDGAATIDLTAYKGKPVEDLLPAVMQAESGGDPNAVSPKGAEGLMQVMPATQVDPGFGVAPAADKSPKENVRLGAEYLDAMLERYKGNQALALMAYNWGPGNVDKWLESGAKGSVPEETRKYVSKILGG